MPSLPVSAIGEWLSTAAEAEDEKALSDLRALDNKERFLTAILTEIGPKPRRGSNELKSKCTRQKMFGY